MKLIHHTISRLAIVLIFIISIWAFLFYINILEEIIDETDDTLENHKELIIKEALKYGVKTGAQRDLFTSYSIREITQEAARKHKNIYFDSTRFYEVELEYDPIRVLKTTFKSKDHRYYELTVMISTLEQDDMIEAIIQWIIILYLTLLICILLVTEIIFRKSLRPLHKLLLWLNYFTPGKQNKPLNNPTQIKEFQQLNEVINKMAQRSEEVYAHQRQFIENASHELQTPLAICQNKLELMAEKTEGNEEQLQDIDEIQQTLHRAVKLNKSLLLLSRIENGQYHNEKEVNFNILIHATLNDLAEIYEHKAIQIKIHEEETLIRTMNESLASILITNLLKNMFIHATPNSVAEINISSHFIEFINTGDNLPLDSSRLFSRFYQANNKKRETNGLGLAIVKSISSYYQIQINYHFDGKHHFNLKF